VNHLFNGIELFRRRHAGHINMFYTAFNKMFYAGHANHEKFIQVGSADGQEIQLFKKRILVIIRFM